MLEGLPWWLLVAFIAAYAVMSVIPAVFLHFFLVFPERSPLLRRFPRFEYYLYLPQLLGTLFYLLKGWLWVKAPERFFDVSREFPLISSLINIELLIYVFGGLVSLVVNYRQASLVSRRKMRVVVAGSIIGFLSAFAFYGVFVVFRVLMPTSLWSIIIITVLLAFSLVPVSFAYAIVRHRVIPVSLIVRRSIQYLLARNGLRVITALPVVGLLLTLFADPNRTLPEILFRSSAYFYLLLIAAFALGLMFRRRLSGWIDRKFFREAYNQEKILRELIEDLRHLDSLREMSEHVNSQVAQALHPERLYLFHREEERHDLLLGHSSDLTTRALRIPAEFRLIRFMERENRAVEVSTKSELPFVERAWLSSLKTNLMVPIISTGGRLSGVFLLGEKKSEVPYTSTDRQLLEAVANQIAVVYENVQLKERVAREQKIRREVLARVEQRDVNLLRECPACGACYDHDAELCPRDHSELTLTLPVERTIEGRYQLNRLIGKGGMGAVYEATDLRLHRAVAVKVLSGSLFGQSEALRRFEREAQAAARLTHPHIIAVHDYGALSTEGAYIVMELVRGETLGSVLKREGRLAPAIAAAWLDQTLAAVGAAHQAGVIHRDLKPDNILIADEEKGERVVKVLDFGLAKITSHEAAASHSPTASVTTPGTVMGTFGYMSPEQLTGTALDERSDLFSVGVIAVEALTGHRPFGGKNYHELLTSILRDPIRFEAGAAVASELAEVLHKCLAKDPEDRFASAAEMQRTLIPAIRCCPATALDVGLNAPRTLSS